MRLPCLKTILLTGVLLCGYGCTAQTMPIRLGDESSNFEADPTINKGTGDLHMHCLATNRIATPAKNNLRALSVHTRWAVGTYPLRLGLEGYRKLGAQYVVELSPRKPAKDEFVLPGVKDYTSVFLGPVAFSVPLAPWSVVRLGICILLALALVLAALLYYWWGDSASDEVGSATARTE